VKQGEIWIVNLDPTIGSEMKKSRPCVILNGDTIGKLPLKVVAPVTDFKEHYKEVPWMVKVEPDIENGLKKTSSIDLFQVRSLSQQRLAFKIGKVDKKTLKECKKALDVVFK